MQLLLMANLDGFGLRWPLGKDNLTIISVGTGSFRRTITEQIGSRYPSAVLAVQALTGLIADSQTAALTLLHWLSGTNPLWPINTEIASLEHDQPPLGHALFGFQRYDAQLESDWLKRELDIALSQDATELVRRMDDPNIIPQAYEIGQAVAKRFVKPEHFASP
jgi:hypothetical protein